MTARADAAAPASGRSNKYDVRAFRKRLESLVRSRSWSALRSALRERHMYPPANQDQDQDQNQDEDQDQDQDQDQDLRAARKRGSDLLRAVVLERNRGGSRRALPHDHPTLLHLLLRRLDPQRPGVPADLVGAIAGAAPEALLVQDHDQQRTPIHLALRRGAGPAVVEALLAADVGLGRKSLHIADRNGEVPLLLHVRTFGGSIDFGDGNVAGILLRNDVDERGRRGGTLLRWGGSRSMVPLAYVVAAELRSGGRLLDSLRIVLARTAEAVLNFNGDWKEGRCDSDGYSDGYSDGDSEIDTAAALRSAVICSHLPGMSRLFERLWDTLLQEGTERGLPLAGLLADPDIRGDTALHVICSPERMCCISATTDRIDAAPAPAPAPATLAAFMIRHAPSACRMANCRGNLPLHVLAAWMVNLRYISNSGDGAVVIATSLYRALSQSHPAGHLVRNWRGEMPIHLAAKGYVRGVQMHGKGWEQRQDQQHQKGAITRATGPAGTPEEHTDGDAAMWLYDNLCWTSDALAEPDGPTGLYPFMLVIARESAADGDANGDSDADSSLESLWLSYVLLRQRPDVVSRFVPHDD